MSFKDWTGKEITNENDIFTYISIISQPEYVRNVIKGGKMLTIDEVLNVMHRRSNDIEK